MLLKVESTTSTNFQKSYQDQPSYLSKDHDADQTQHHIFYVTSNLFHQVEDFFTTIESTSHHGL